MCYNIGAVQRAAFFFARPRVSMGKAVTGKTNGPKKAVAGAATCSAKILKIINI